MSYKAMIFDLDGTLADSLADLTDAVNFALGCFGLQPHNLKAVRKMVGEGTRTLISRALPPDRQDLIEQALAKMRDRYMEICLNKTRPYDGIPEVLAELRNHGVKMAVLTNKDQKMSEKIVTHFFDGYFTIIVGTVNAVPVKPHPKAVLRILRELKVEPEDAAFVGDSNIDIQTARAAGIKAIGVNWGFRGEQELKEAGADYTIDEPKALLDL